MKSAEEIIAKHGVHARWGDNDTEYTSLCASDIRGIQLDAMKEGASRAADFVADGSDLQTCMRDILSAANQWTEKDLC